MGVHPCTTGCRFEIQLEFFKEKNIFLKLVHLKYKEKPHIPSFCSTSCAREAPGELRSREFTFSSEPFGDTGSRLTCTEESGGAVGVMPEGWNGDGMFTCTEAPSGCTEEDKVSKRGRKEPVGIMSAAV